MPKSSKKIQVIAVAPKTGKRKSRRRGSKRTMLNPNGQTTVDYFKSLVDPFECSPPKLGWGCMVPTTVSQAYIRASFTTNADGSGAIMLVPSATGGILVNTSGLSGTTWANVNFANSSAVASNFGEGRVISMGIKATPNIALTSVPGMVYAGAFTPTTYVNLITLSPSDLVSAVTSHQSISTNGATATGRPVDPDSFTFLAPIVSTSNWTAAANSGTSLPFSIPYICFSGLPTLSTVFYEVCMNFEGTPITSHNASTVIPAAADSYEPKLSDQWVSPEQVYNKMKPFLPHPGRSSDAEASKDSSFLQTMLSGIGTAIGGAIGGPAGAAIGGFGGKAIGSIAQGLLGSSARSRKGATQDYSRSLGGYRL